MLSAKINFNWAGLDSNQRSITQRIYNPPPLTTRTPTPFNSIFYHIKKQKTRLELEIFKFILILTLRIIYVMIFNKYVLPIY